MTWSLYLDDIRMPPPVADWTLARTVAEAQRLIQEKGPPVYCSLDHDMGVNYCRSCAFRDAEEPCFDGDQGISCDCNCHTVAPTGYDLLKWIQDTNLWPVMKPTVHSANPVGAKRMLHFIEDFGPYEKP